MILEQFLTWMQTAPVEGRCRATAALARSFLVSDIDDVDREAIVATLTVMLDDPEPEISRIIAEILAPSRDAPRHLILALAEGPPDVAAVVLQNSPVLIEAELVDFIAEGTVAAQAAIAARAWLSPGVSAAIAEVGELDACIMLARNPTAAIPAFSLLKLAQRFGGEFALREAMLTRAHLPIEARHALMIEASLALMEGQADRAWIREERALSVAIEVKDKTTVQMAAAASSQELPQFVEHLRATGQLTTTLLLRAVTLGDVRFLQEALTMLSRLPRRRVEGLIIEGRESACRALFIKAGIPERVFPAFFAALDVQRELAQELGMQTPNLADDHRFAARVVERVLTKCREGSAASEDDLIVLLRRFATEAARDAARALVADMTRRPPLLLSAPDQIEDVELAGVEEDWSEEAWSATDWAADAGIELGAAGEIRVVNDDFVDYAAAYPVYAEVRAA